MTTAVDTRCLDRGETTDLPAPLQTRRRWAKRVLIACGGLLFLVWIFDFDPLHPVRWAHEFHAAYERGARAGKAARLRREARHRASSQVHDTMSPRQTATGAILVAPHSASPSAPHSAPGQ
jgi:hypothetical protein